MNVYVMDGDGRTNSLQRVSCRNEERELQQLLERNLDLLPGDQIDPDNGVRWLLIKREMPVVSPASGSDSWSIDFLLVDHLGVPTFVECKRCNDTRARREVVAQMLDYVANGSHYWEARQLQQAAQVSAGSEHALSQKLEELTGSGDAEAFFKSVVSNLEQAKVRLIFFLEEAPLELRSMVEFLNKQLKETEVLIVEARQYDLGTVDSSTQRRVVVPHLFGYTEQARVAKRASKAELVRTMSARGEEPFWEAIQQSTGSGHREPQIRAFISSVQAVGGCHANFIQNCVIYLDHLSSTRGICAINRNGGLEIYFHFWHPDKFSDVTPSQAEFIAEFRHGLLRIFPDVFGKEFSDRQLRGFPTATPEQWVPKADDLLKLLQRLVSEAPANPGEVNPSRKLISEPLHGSPAHP